MASISKTIEKNHKLIISVLALVIVALAASCIFHDVITICHHIFGCDHNMHVISAF